MNSKGGEKHGEARERYQMGPAGVGSKWQQVKNENRGPRDIAVKTDGSESLTLWDAGSYVWVLPTGFKSIGLWQT